MPAADCAYDELAGSNRRNGIQWRNISSAPLYYESASQAVCMDFATGATNRYGFKFNCLPNITFSGMTALNFDLYISDVAKADVNGNWKMLLVCTDKSLTLSASLAQLAEWSDITLVNGWNRFEIPLGCFNNVSGTMKLKEFQFFKNNDNAIGPVTFKLKNVYFIDADTIVPTIMASSFGDMTGGGSATGLTNKPNLRKYGYLSDTAIKYDGNQNMTCAFFNYSGAITDANGFLINTSWSELDITAMNKLCFDLYISDMSLVTPSTANFAVDLAFTDKTSKDGSANYASNTRATLDKFAKAAGITLKSGWNHFELPMTKQGSDATQGLFWAASHNVASKGLKYIRIYANGGTGMGVAGQSLTIGLRNVYFANDGIAWNTTPSTPGVAKVASAQPTLTNSFNLTYTVSADANIVCKPLVDLTYGDTTTRQTLSTDGTFAFNDIFAHRIADTITTTVTALDKNGDIVKSTHTYSVKDYGERMLAKESIEGYSADKLTAFKRLVSDMLYYGAAAQTYANYNADNLASNVSGIVPNTNVGESFAIAESTLTGRPSGEYSGTGPKWRGVTLVLDSAMCIRYSFTADSVEGLALTCSNGKSYTSFASASDANGTYYYIDVPVNATEFDTAFTVSFDGVENYDLAYSVNHYVATKRDPSMIKTSALLEAIYNYGVSADAFAAAQ